MDLIRSYLRDISGDPLLSHEQEITLGRQVQKYTSERKELEIIELTGDKVKNYQTNWLSVSIIKKDWELDRG